MSERTPTTYAHWERYADELAVRVQRAARNLLDARAQEESWKILANRANERADQFEQQRDEARKAVQQHHNISVALREENEKYESALAGLADVIDQELREACAGGVQVTNYLDDMRPFVHTLVDAARANERWLVARAAKGGGDEPVSS